MNAEATYTEDIIIESKYLSTYLNFLLLISKARNRAKD